MKRKIILSVSLLAIMTVMVMYSCKLGNKQDNGNNGYADVKVNPEYERTPPLAEDVSVQKIDGDSTHVLVLASFAKGQLKEQALAINLDAEVVVLHDDGKNGDKTAGDGIYTVRVEGTMEEVRAATQSHVKAMLKRPSVHFEKRVMVQDDPQELQRIFAPEVVSRDLISLIKFRPLFTPVPPANTDSNCLMVTDLRVVEDPTRTWNSCKKTGTVDGPWTFGRLMREMASPDPAHIADDNKLSAFVLAWLNTWMSNQSVNGFTVAQRNAIETQVIKPWQSKSAAPGKPAGFLDMKFSPFKLMAIVNRLDLRGNSGYGFSSAGEGRFVFCVMDQSDCNPMLFTTIFEYGVNKKKCSEVKAFANQWLALSGMSRGSTAYNAALQAITDQFSKCGTNPSKPNQNSINQVRTDEIALAGPWQLREFNLVGTPGQLTEVTVKQEPDSSFNDLNASDARRPANPNIDILAAYVNSNAANIINNKYTVPATQSGKSFLGGAAETNTPSHFWDGTAASGPGFITSDDARASFSVNTCSGCHGGETQTFFTQVHPVPFGTEAGLSTFLSGLNTAGVPDPAGRPAGGPVKVRHFADLQRRALDLEQLASTPCRGIFGLREVLTFDPLRMEH